MYHHLDANKDREPIMILKMVSNPIGFSEKTRFFFPVLALKGAGVMTISPVVFVPILEYMYVPSSLQMKRESLL